MRRLFLGIFLIIIVGTSRAFAQNNVVQEFSGSGSTTTALFKVQDRWEVRWNARQVVSVAVMAADGTIVAGGAGVLRGSLFVPLGGQYYLKINDGTANPPAGTGAAPPPSTNAPPPASSDNSGPSPAEPMASWHVQVVELEKSVTSDQALTVYTPFFMVPDSAVSPVAPPPDLPPPTLTAEQAQTVVTIKGDNAQGSGVLMRSTNGTFVVTHLHLLAANPNVKIFTGSGAPVTVVTLKGATDRDLALFTIEDDHYNYLPLPTDDATSAAPGDLVIIPDIGGPSNPLVGKNGKVISASPERIDFDNAMGPGSSGAPVIDVKSGSFLALVTAQKQVDFTDFLAKAWPANPAPGSAGIIPYYGLRLSASQSWETYDWTRFLGETLFLKQFHDNTRSLDSYLNGRRRRDQTEDDQGPPDNRYFLKNVKIHTASDGFKQLANGSDRNEQIEAARELLFSLQDIANADLETLQSTNSLYSYDRSQAQEELVYRNALKKELDDLSNNLARLANIARSR